MKIKISNYKHNITKSLLLREHKRISPYFVAIEPPDHVLLPVCLWSDACIKVNMSFIAIGLR